MKTLKRPKGQRRRVVSRGVDEMGSQEIKKGENGGWGEQYFESWAGIFIRYSVNTYSLMVPKIPKKGGAGGKRQGWREKEEGTWMRTGEIPKRIRGRSKLLLYCAPLQFYIEHQKDPKPYFYFFLIFWNPFLFLKYLVREESCELVQSAPLPPLEFSPWK